MSEARQPVSFAELCSARLLVIGDGYRAKLEELGGSGPIFLRAGKLSQDGFDWRPTERFLDELADRVAPKMGMPGDTVITTKGNSTGRTGYVSCGSPAFVYSPHLSYWRSLDHARIDPGFLRYWARSPEFRGQLNAMAHGTDMAPYLSLADQQRLLITLPEIGLQRGIAATLGALDGKIESNRRISALVLDLAEALYLRSCAEGASEVALKNAGRWLSGGTPTTSNPTYWGGDLPWISASSLKTFYVDESERTLTAAGAEAATNIVPAGALLMVVRGMSLKTEFRFGVAQRPVAFGQDCKALLPSIPGSVLAIALRSLREPVLELVDEAGHGTGRLQTDRLEQIRISVPDDSAVVVALDSLLARGAAAARETKTLERLRDALLPELLSGRIRVPEAVELNA